MITNTGKMVQKSIKERLERQLCKEQKMIESMIIRDSCSLYDNPLLYISEEEAMEEEMKDSGDEDGLY